MCVYYHSFMNNLFPYLCCTKHEIAAISLKTCSHFLSFLISVSHSVQLLSHVQLFPTPWTPVCQVSLSNNNSQSLLKLMSIEWVMPSNHLILYHPLFFLPSIFPSIRVFFDESALCIKWLKYWNLSFSVSLSNDYSGLISFRVD